MSRQECYGICKGPPPSNLRGASTAVKAVEPKTLEEIRKGGGAQLVTFQAVVLQVKQPKMFKTAAFEGTVVSAFVGDGSCM